MLQRIPLSDRIVGAAAALAALLVFAPWSSAQSASTDLTLNGFRTFPFGLLFYVGAIGSILLILRRANYLQFEIPRDMAHDRALRWTTAAMLLSAVIEFVRNLGSQMHGGFWLAFLLSIACAAVAWRDKLGGRVLAA